MFQTIGYKRHAGRGALGCFLAMQLLAAANLRAADTARGSLRQMSEDFEALARKVSPAVVKILVVGYGPVEEDSRQQTGMIGRQRSIGSGVIVSPNGYIVTNAHVVEGAQRVRAVLTPATDGREPGQPARGRTLDAKIAGVDKNSDLAVLKVDVDNLPTLPIGDYRNLRQGQVVLAFGSPEGLENSVTMGVVSSAMRQPDPDEPMVYIQTDAAVNPGNSGGPLVDIDGNLVGINTFIISESGGNEGMGFAIPSVIVRYVYEEILAHGHVHRPQIGADMQTISPELAAGLGLGRDSGLIVSDLDDGGPAAKAGLKVADIVLSLDGTPVESLPLFEAALYRKQHGGPVALEVLRGSKRFTLNVRVVEERERDFDELADLVKPDQSLVEKLGILGLEITPKIAEVVSGLRISSGVLVAARAADTEADTGLRPGDVIHAVNGAGIKTLEGLKSALGRLKPGDAVAIQLERDGRLMYLAFELE